MPFADLPASPLAPEISPVRVYYRRYGQGVPLLILHGGWGYQVYPFEHQIAELQPEFDIIIPDRTGYGRSLRLDRFPARYHETAAAETLALLEALGLRRCVLWGHSDGAVIAANLALTAPARVAAVIMEATHYDRAKPASQEFFAGLGTNPWGVGERMAARLLEDHGPDYWQQVLAMEGEVWLDILAQAADPAADLYGGRLAELAVPTLLLHGAEDPRTEPQELATLQRLLPHANFAILAEGKHSPHSERATAAECTRLARQFLSRLGLAAESDPQG